MTEEQRRKIHKFCDELDAAEAASNLGSYDNMVSWLRRDHYTFYLEVKNILREVWEEIKSTVSDIVEGVATGVLGVAATPFVGLYEGFKEGLDNGFEAGVKKGFKAIGDFWDDLLS